MLCRRLANRPTSLISCGTLAARQTALTPAEPSDLEKRRTTSRARSRQSAFIHVLVSTRQWNLVLWWLHWGLSLRLPARPGVGSLVGIGGDGWRKTMWSIRYLEKKPTRLHKC